MKKSTYAAAKLGNLPDGQTFKRTTKSRTWFRVITKGDFGVVVTSAASNYSAIMKKSAKVFI